MVQTLKDATLRFIVIGGKTYVQTPLGDTSFTNPTQPPNQGTAVSTFEGMWDFEYNEDEIAKDSSSPAVIFCEYVGGRPSGR